jgi:hypothetical protein
MMRNPVPFLAAVLLSYILWPAMIGMVLGVFALKAIIFQMLTAFPAGGFQSRSMAPFWFGRPGNAVIACRRGLCPSIAGDALWGILTSYGDTHTKAINSYEKPLSTPPQRSSWQEDQNPVIGS